MCSLWEKIENNSSQTIRVVRIFLLLLIVVGVGLLFTQGTWVPEVVNLLL